MKYIIIIIIIGISEVALTGELHDLIGLKDMLLVYITTTFIGALVLYYYSSKAKLALKASKKLRKKPKKKTSKSSYIHSKEEVIKLQPSIYISSYIASVILIVVPGILTDFIGIIIVLPFINKWYINKEIHKLKSEQNNA